MAEIELAKKADLDALDNDLILLQDSVSMKSDMSHTHSYSELTNKPTIPNISELEAQVSSLAGTVSALEATVGSLTGDLSNANTRINNLEAEVENLKGETAPE